MENKKPIDSGLYLTNTLTRKKEAFKPRKGNKVKMFTCGPSIYRRPHIGNYRTFLYEDILYRYLKYLGYHVERIINFTDIEDKALAEAQHKGITLEKLTNPIAKQFLKEAALLKINLPDYIPRSSTSVEHAVRLIKTLLEKGYAYWHGKDIFYDPLKFKGFGKLFGLDMSRWPKKKRRFGKDTYPGQRWNLGDFILWHGYKEGQGGSFYWETEIGKGRPAWSIQDPAMITKHLGFQIDISCGGADNLYRHHDYTIAVMEAVSGKEFAHYWLHGDHVFINGSKMSKSKGNIVYPENLLEKGYSARHLRFYLIYGHYRKRMNLTDKTLQEARGKCDSLNKMVKEIRSADPCAVQSHDSAEKLINGMVRAFEKQMNDDLNVKGAFDALHKILSELGNLTMNQQLSARDCKRVGKALKEIDAVLQVIYT